LKWQKEKVTTNTFKASIEITTNSKWEAWVLLTSDRHWDNPKSNHELQLEHLNEAKKRGALIIDCGDLFCAMQGKYDKRSSKASVRPEHQVDNYLDAIVSGAAKFFKPYRDNFLCIGVGNHESSVKINQETDLVERLLSLMNAGSKNEVYNGHYTGWVKFCFLRGRHNCGVRTKSSCNLHYYHGFGGGSGVDKDKNRAAYLPDADIVVSGHNHQSWVYEHSRVRFTDRCLINHDIQTHIKLPTYKEEYGQGEGGWHVETGKSSRPQGAWWLRFFYSRKHDKVFYETIRATS